MIEEFAIHYDLEKLQNELKNKGIYDEFFDIFNNSLVQELFDFSLKHGIYDVVEFLYINKSTLYDINELVDIIDSVTRSDDDHGKVSLVTNLSGNEGMRLEFWSKNDDDKSKCVKRLLELRKYSIMLKAGKTFKYIFNKKYFWKIYQ